MKLLCPDKLSMFDGWIEKEDIIFRFELKLHSFGHKDKILFLLILRMSEADELIYPLFDKAFQPGSKNAFNIKIEFSNPNMNVRDISLAKLINNLLNAFYLFKQCFFLQGAVCQRLDD